MVKILQFMLYNYKKYIFTVVLYSIVQTSTIIYSIYFIIYVFQKLKNNILLLDCNLGVYLFIFIFLSFLSRAAKIFLNYFRKVNFIEYRKKITNLISTIPQESTQDIKLQNMNVQFEYLMNSEGVVTIFLNFFSDIVLDIIFFIFAFILMLFLKLYIEILIVISFCVVSYFIKKRYETIEEKLSTEMAEINNYVSQFSKCLYDVKTAIERRYYKFIINNLNDIYKKVKQEEFIFFKKVLQFVFRVDLSGELILWISIIAIYSTIIISTTFSDTYVLNFIFFASISVNSIIFINYFFSTTSNLRQYSTYVMPILEYEDYLNKLIVAENKLIITSIETIEFIDVSYRYPSSKKYAINKVSFKIHKGEKIYIIGSNGSGKSTLFKLLIGQIKPTEGKILINNINISNINISSYIDQLAYLTQNIPLISIPVEDYFDFSDQRILKMLEDLNLNKVISTYKQNAKVFFTKNFDNNGIELSSGEIKKIYIIYLLSLNKDVLLIDEIDSNLDSNSRYRTEKYIKEQYGKGIVITITHNYNSFDNGDTIIVMENGSIESFGTHDDLIQNSNLYAALVNNNC